MSTVSLIPYWKPNIRTSKNTTKAQSKPDQCISTSVPGTYLISYINYVLQIMQSVIHVNKYESTSSPHATRDLQAYLIVKVFSFSKVQDPTLQNLHSMNQEHCN